MPGRLNNFQRTMLHWNDLYPYNAVNVVRLPVVLDLTRLAQVINNLLATQGLTHLTLNRSQGTFCYHGGAADCEIRSVSHGANPINTVADEISHQLNTPFIIKARFNPFRFFVVPELAGFSLGIVYFHAIADAEAVLLLVRELVETYLAHKQSNLSQPLDLYPKCRDGVLSHPRMLARKLAALPAYLRDMRSSARRYCRDENDYGNRCDLFTMDAAALPALLRTAKAWDITLNDLFLALLLKCFSRLQSDRLSHHRRRKISIGCIVNLRKDLGLGGRRAFGPFLGSFVVTHALSSGITLQEIAQDIRHQTATIKKSRLYLGSSLELAVGRVLFSGYSGERQKRLYQKHFPLWGGITNVNLNTLWDQCATAQSFDCLSAVSTGPLVPLVFSVMTVRDRLNVALTYRPSFFSESDIGQIKHDLLEQLTDLEKDR
ncbi:MAG TPA: condensation domain-containing protein [Verrucomicrobiae bacterium]|nr:condensation domain-containing protein [Verrucomicrobiae bacterium]